MQQIILNINLIFYKTYGLTNDLIRRKKTLKTGYNHCLAQI